MPPKSRRPEVGSTLQNPDLAAEVSLDVLFETAITLALHRKKVEELKTKRDVFREIENNLRANDAEARILSTATREFTNVSLGRLVEEDAVVDESRVIRLFSEVAKFPEVAPHFQRRLANYLHEVEGEILLDDPTMWSVLASFAEKYGEEIR